MFPQSIFKGYEVGGYGACQGDSGGPIVRFVTSGSFIRYILVGVVQGGVGTCGDSKIPGIFVRMEAREIGEFVRDVMGGKNTSSLITIRPSDGKYSAVF